MQVCKTRTTQLRWAAKRIRKSARKSQKVVNFTRIQLTCDQVVSTCVGWPNNVNLAPTQLRTNLSSRTKVHGSSHRKSAWTLRWLASICESVWRGRLKTYQGQMSISRLKLSYYFETIKTPKGLTRLISTQGVNGRQQLVGTLCSKSSSEVISLICCHFMIAFSHLNTRPAIKETRVHRDRGNVLYWCRSWWWKSGGFGALFPEVT